MAQLSTLGSETHHDIQHWRYVMKKIEHRLDEPGQQLFWKITLTVLCVVVGAIAAHYLFRLF